eukprot:1776744-Pleurochrysis_carterae.AAC.1
MRRSSKRGFGAKRLTTLTQKWQQRSITILPGRHVLVHTNEKTLETVCREAVGIADKSTELKLKFATLSQMHGNRLGVYLRHVFRFE